MAYSESLAIRIRERLADIPNVEEKKMMGGLAFMVDDKMFVAILEDGLLCLIAPEIYLAALEKPHCRVMDFSGRIVKGWVMIDETGVGTIADFEYWVTLALDLTSKLWLRKGIKYRNNLRLTKFLKLRKSL